MSGAKWVPLALLACAPIIGCKPPQTEAKSEPPTIEVSTPVSGDVTNYEVFTGRTQALNTADLRARVTGYLKEAYFKEGEDVKKDEVLFLIDPDPYDAVLNQAKANLDLQKAQRKYNDAEFQRQSNLFAQQAASKDDLDKARAARETSVAQVGAADAAVRTAQLNVDFTKVRAPFAGRISRRKVDPGADIQADVTVMVNLVQMDPMYAYFDMDERSLLRIRHYLPEGKIPADAATKLPIVLGFANEKPEQFSHKGVLKFTDNSVDPTTATGTLRMWGIFENPKRDLYAGLFIRVRMQIPVEQPEKWKFVSEKAINSEQNSKYLYVVKKEKEQTKEGETRAVGVASRLDIDVGQAKDGLIAVKPTKSAEEKKQPLTDETLVVVNNLQRVKPNMKIPADKLHQVEMPRAKTTTAPGTPGAANSEQGTK